MNTPPPRDRFSAGPQGLGYIYQGRLALLKLLQLSEDNALLLEKDDDIEIVEQQGGRTLASLKYKAEGNRITDLSTDFWRSARIWLKRYEQYGRRASKIQFVVLQDAIARVEEVTELPVRCLAQLSLAGVVWSISSAGHASRHPSE